MNNGDLPASPLPVCGDGIAWKVSDLGNPALVIGLTKREQFAMAAMQGLLSCKQGMQPKFTAQCAVKYADELLAELERTK